MDGQNLDLAKGIELTADDLDDLLAEEAAPTEESAWEVLLAMTRAVQAGDSSGFERAFARFMEIG